MSAVAVSKFWTRELILDAIRTWAREHGEPPTSGTWKHAGYGHPSALTVWRTFPELRFADVIRLAGAEPFRHGPRKFWTRDRVAEALLDHLLREGCWPEQREWAVSGGPAHPTLNLVDDLFGNFTNAKLYAGWRPECAVCQKAFRPAKSNQLFCSMLCCQRGRRRRLAGLPLSEPIASGCVGCGCDLDVYVTGCSNCHDRKRRRVRRAAEQNGTYVSAVESPSAGDSCASQPRRAMAPVRPVDFQTEKAA